MGVRRVRNSGENVIGTFPSLKMREQIPYESTIERDLLFFLEYDARVVRYQAQPFEIVGSSADGTAHSYIPDFQVIRTDGQEIVECKPAARLNDVHTQQQLALGQTWADTNQHLFVVITDTHLRAGHRLANLKLLALALQPPRRLCPPDRAMPRFLRRAAWRHAFNSISLVPLRPGILIHAVSGSVQSLVSLHASG
jgi:TnsA endonuclease N terminal